MREPDAVDAARVLALALLAIAATILLVWAGVDVAFAGAVHMRINARAHEAGDGDVVAADGANGVGNHAGGADDSECVVVGVLCFMLGMYIVPDDA